MGISKEKVRWYLAQEPTKLAEARLIVGGFKAGRDNKRYANHPWRTERDTSDKRWRIPWWEYGHCLSRRFPELTQDMLRAMLWEPFIDGVPCDTCGTMIDRSGATPCGWCGKGLPSE